MSGHMHFRYLLIGMVSLVLSAVLILPGCKPKAEKKSTDKSKTQQPDADKKTGDDANKKPFSPG